MKDQRVAIDTDREQGILFRITEQQGLYRVYKQNVGLIWDSPKKVGECHDLHTALSLAKSAAGGRIRDVRVSNW